MARFYPKTFETDSRPKSEDKVFNIIKNSFPDTWVVFLSFDYVNRSDNGIDQDGEVDFILYNPKHGILVLEVKGGAIRHCDGVWYSGAHVIHPYKQASKNKHAIRALFSKDTDEFPRISISHAVCFPDVKDRIPQLPAEANGITLTAADFNDFENKCIEIMLARPVFSNADVPHISYDEVMQTLSPNFDFAYSLREEIERDRKIFIKLSNLQYDAFRSLKNFKRLNIRGCAGSGKTVIAVKLAQELAQEGKNVLVLCFNKILANRLQNMVGAYHNIRAEAFFEFCVEIAKVPREDVQKFANNPKTWTHGLPILAQKAIQSQGIAYDAVIVDEGQDFSAQAWETIKMLPYEDGVFHIFYDDDQNIYHSTLNIPQAPYPEITLSVNYRNTKKIFNALKGFISLKDVKINDCAPEGYDTEFYTIPDEQERRDFIHAKLRSLVNEHKVALGDIVILGGHTLKNTCIKEREFGEFFIDENVGPTSPNEIKYRTYMKFKGCETPVVIVIDVDKDDSRWKNGSALYTSMSRAQSLLIVVSKK